MMNGMFLIVLLYYFCGRGFALAQEKTLKEIYSLLMKVDSFWDGIFHGVENSVLVDDMLYGRILSDLLMCRYSAESDFRQRSLTKYHEEPD
jgi:hypothetical protein